MKGKFFFFALGALALTACTSEDVLEQNTKSLNVIGFENGANKFTKAEDLTYSSLEQFNVFGFYTTPDNDSKAVEVFNDTPVKRNDNGDWSYKEDLGEFRYWVPGGHYYFYAYSCGSVSKLDTKKYGSFTMNMADGLTASNRVLMINNYVCDASHQHDLIFASNTGAVEGNEYAGILGKEKGNGDVTLHFQHLLSKVGAKFTNKFPAGYTTVVSNVYIDGLMTQGNYDPRNGGSWNGQSAGATSLVYLHDTSNPAINPIRLETGLSDTSNTAYVLPNSYNGADGTADDTYIYMKFNLVVYNNGEVVLNKTLSGKFSPSWAIGHSYLYNIELSGSAADLDVIAFVTQTDASGKVVSDWVDGGEKPIFTSNN